MLLVIGAVILIAVVGQYFVNRHVGDVQDSIRDQQAQARVNQLHACQLGNRRLRRTINQRVVSPIRAVLSLSPESRHFARIFRTVPYANCGNLYPVEGEPHPPFYRSAPLPPLLKPRREGGTTSQPQSQQGRQLASHPRPVAQAQALSLRRVLRLALHLP
jgi:hypothetical protein